MQGAGNQQFAMAMAGTMFDGAEQFFTQSTGAALGMNLNDKGATTTLLADFSEDGSFAKSIKGMKSTDASLLAGLPEGNYMMAGGFADIGEGF